MFLSFPSKFVFLPFFWKQKLKLSANWKIINDIARTLYTWTALSKDISLSVAVKCNLSIVVQVLLMSLT